MHQTNRRAFIAAGAAAAAGGPALAASPKETLWTFDTLGGIGGAPTRFQGAPSLVASPQGPALAFDGKSDAVFIGKHPLAGALTYTMEAIFRPDGGAFEQRWLHLESDETPAVAPGKGKTRMLFEIRVVESRWYLDAFMTGDGYKEAMMATDKLFPIGRWHHVAQTYDGKLFRAFVDGALQMQVETPFTAQGPGKACVGARMDPRDYFHGAIRQARFTHAALPPARFLRAG